VELDDALVVPAFAEDFPAEKEQQVTAHDPEGCAVGFADAPGGAEDVGVGQKREDLRF
jgi:hypothetical protein